MHVMSPLRLQYGKRSIRRGVHIHALCARGEDCVNMGRRGGKAERVRGCLVFRLEHIIDGGGR